MQRWPLSFADGLVGCVEAVMEDDSILEPAGVQCVEMQPRRMLFSTGEGSRANACSQSTARASQQALVAVARAHHLPAEAFARAAHAHPT